MDDSVIDLCDSDDANNNAAADSKKFNDDVSDDSSSSSSSDDSHLWKAGTYHISVIKSKCCGFVTQ